MPSISFSWELLSYIVISALILAQSNSIGFKSGEYTGCQCTLIPKDSNTASTASVLWYLALSYKNHTSSNLVWELINCLTWRVNISMYVYSFMLPSNATINPFFSREIHPKMLTLNLLLYLLLPTNFIIVLSPFFRMQRYLMLDYS